MSAKAFILFIIVLAAVSGGVYICSYDLGSTDGYELGYTTGNTEGYNTGHEEGYGSGHTDGYEEGNTSGYLLGFNDGEDEGYTTGYTAGNIVGTQNGFTDGQSQGYELGYVDGNISGYQIGHLEGNYTGYILGLTLGNVTGFDIGYLTGVTDGAGSGYTIRNPTYSEVLKFIWSDQTDKNDYIDDVYVCRHFSSDVIRHSYDRGYRGFFVYIAFGNSAHAIVAFNTTDRGIVYFEPQTDDRVYPTLGEVYWDRSKYYPPSYDDTITEILIVG